MSDIVKRGKDLKALLETDSVKDRLEEILGKNAATFAASVVQIANSNDKLKEAEPSSILGAAMTSATLNLPLNNSLGHAYIVPFGERQSNGSYIKKAQFQIGYKGLKQLAIRSGQFKNLYCKEVYEGQLSETEDFLGYEFDWSGKKSEKVIGYASYFKLINGFESYFYMTKQEVDKHGKEYSQTYKRGFGLWKDKFDKMALKTITKLHLNGGEAPLSIEMQNAIQSDQAVVSYQDDDVMDISYSDNEEAQVEHDHEGERIKTLIENVENEEDVEFIRPHITEKFLPLFKEKIKEVNKRDKKESKQEPKPKTKK